VEIISFTNPTSALPLINIVVSNNFQLAKFCGQPHSLNCLNLNKLFAMCGRYVIQSKIEFIERKFNLKPTENPSQYKINFNVCPTDIVPVITDTKPNELQFFAFGMTPSWSKKRMNLYNARAEGDNNQDNDPDYTGGKGIIHKPSYRDPIRNRRCAVIADCFYEGDKVEGLSKPYLVYLQGHNRPFAFAGIWDEWKDPKTQETIYSFAIITTVANDLMMKINHDRSPVILHDGQIKRWLSKESSLMEITHMLQPYPAKLMNAYPVSTKMKNARNKGKELVEPTGQRVYTEHDLQITHETKVVGMGEKKRSRDDGSKWSDTNK
jgi:putative SOS response-associated peptidase YedK